MVFTEVLACNVLTVPEPVTVSVVVFTEVLACKLFVIILDVTTKLVPTVNDCPIAPSFETFNSLPLILFVSVILLPLISLVTARYLFKVVLAATDSVLFNVVTPVTFKAPPIFAVFATISPVFGARANSNPPMFACPVLVRPNVLLVK